MYIYMYIYKLQDLENDKGRPNYPKAYHLYIYNINIYKYFFNIIYIHIF